MKHSYILALLFSVFTLPAFGQIVGENMIENFENVNKIQYAFRSGTLDSGVANTVSGGVNTSPFVGKYARSAGAQYDVIVCNLRGGSVRDIASYLSGAKKFSMKVYTNAPVGTNIELTIQNAAASLGGYPQGRHSVYRQLVTQSNAWVNMVFDFATQPATNVDPNTLDQLIISFNNNSNTDYLYYFDELAGPTLGAAATVPNNDFLWTNANNVNKMRFKGSDGALTRAANPSRSAAHLVDSAAKYVRSNVQYDVLRFKWASQLTNLADYRSNSKKFSLNVFSPAAGTSVQFTLQDSIAALGGYPAGRYGEFTGITTVANGWERVTLTYVNNPDPAVTDANVNELAILFNSGLPNPITVYVDTIYGPQFNFVATKGKVSQNLTVSPNPAQDYFMVTLDAATSATTVEMLDVQGRLLSTQRFEANNTQGTQSHRVSTAALPAGVYQCRVVNATGFSVKKVVVQ
jgi:hypothetical protein